MNEYSGMPDKSTALETLRVLSALLDEIGSPKWEVEETYALVSRFKEVVSNVHSRLRLAGTSLITVDWIQAIEGNSQALIDLAQSLKDSAPALNLDLPSTNNQLDDLVNAAAPLPAIPLRTTRQVVERALRQFDEQVTAERREISSLAAEVQSQIAGSRDELERTKSDIDNYLTNQRGEIEGQVEQMGNSLNELAGRTSEAVERLERDVTNNQEVFRQSQESREQAFMEAQAARHERFEGSTKSTLTELEGYRDQARDMLAEVGGAGSAQHYAKQRDAQKRSADIWRRIGLGTLVLLVLAAIGVFVEAAIVDREFSVVWLVARSGALASILLFSTYALRQSGQHRRREEEIDRVANELTLLWPFMSRLPDEDRKELMLGITPLYFKGGLPMRDQTEHASWLDSIRSAVGRRQDRSSNSERL